VCCQDKLRFNVKQFRGFPPEFSLESPRQRSAGLIVCLGWLGSSFPESATLFLKGTMKSQVKVQLYSKVNQFACGFVCCLGLLTMGDMDHSYFRQRLMLPRQSQTNGFERLEVTDMRESMLWMLYDLSTPVKGESFQHISALSCPEIVI
jgi:hypothetical protein